MTSKIDYRALKLIPIGSVLQHYRIETRRQGEYLVAAKCPLPFHVSKETDTFKVNVKENWWTCFSGSCRTKNGQNGGDVIDLVRALDDVGAVAAGQKLTELFCLNGNASKELPADEVAMVNKPLKFKLQSNPEHHLIQNRGISVAAARSWNVGYYRSKQGTASMDGRIIFEIVQNGSVVGYVGRATNDGQEPKWRVGKGLHRGLVLYGIERCEPSKPIVVCESYWAPVWFSERGQQCCALGSADMTEEQERLLEPFGTIILGLDNDEVGRKASSVIAERLKEQHRVIRAVLKEG